MSLLWCSSLYQDPRETGQKTQCQVLDMGEMSSPSPVALSSSPSVLYSWLCFDNTFGQIVLSRLLKALQKLTTYFTFRVLPSGWRPFLCKKLSFIYIPLRYNRAIMLVIFLL